MLKLGNNGIIYRLMGQFIDEVCLQKIFDEKSISFQSNSREFRCLKSVIQMECLHLIETAIKFMNNDKRQKLQEHDIIIASQENNHPDYIFDESISYAENLKTSPFHIIKASQYIQQELHFFSQHQLNHQPISARWLVVDHKITNISDNTQLISYRQIKQRTLQKHKQNKLLATIVKDNPKALLTTQELLYYETITSIICENSNPNERFSIEGDSSSLIPFFIKYFCQNGINETGINFVLSLLQTKAVWQGIQFFLSRMLNLLLCYNGPQAFDVGVKIAQLVLNFEIKYPKLRDIYLTTHRQVNYSNVLKKIPFAFYYDVIFELSQQFLRTMERERESGMQMAVRCWDALSSYSHLLILELDIMDHPFDVSKFWHPTSRIEMNDAYLNMMI